MGKIEMVVKYLERKLTTVETDWAELLPEAMPYAGYSCRYTKEVWMGKSKRAKKFRERIKDNIEKNGKERSGS